MHVHRQAEGAVDKAEAARRAAERRASGAEAELGELQLVVNTQGQEHQKVCEGCFRPTLKNKSLPQYASTQHVLSPSHMCYSSVQVLKSKVRTRLPRYAQYY